MTCSTPILTPTISEVGFATPVTCSTPILTPYFHAEHLDSFSPVQGPLQQEQYIKLHSYTSRTWPIFEQLGD